MISNEAKNKKAKKYLKKIKKEEVLQLIFGYIKYNKTLNIIRYNKNIQKKMNKDIKDYKNEYFKIVIEIIPISINPKKKESGKFINIMENTKKYFHIYFNGNELETKRNTIYQTDKIKKIKIIIDGGSHILDLRGLFKKCRCIETIDFVQFNRDDITDMSDMFNSCTSLKKLYISRLKTNNVKFMINMFSNCTSLKEIDLTNFNTKMLKK